MKKVILVIIMLACFSLSAFAEKERPSFLNPGYLDAEGTRYSFYNDNEYSLSNAISLTKISQDSISASYLRIYGDLVSEDRRISGVPVYYVNNGTISLYLGFSSLFFDKQKVLGWELFNDTASSIDGIKMEYQGESFSVKKGALIIQVSADMKNWVNIMIVNVDNENNEPISFDIKQEHINTGCYYRVIYTYEMRREKPNKGLFADKYEYNSFAEIFTFYIYNEATSIEFKTDQQFRLGKLTKTEDNFFGSKIIDTKDPHYGFNLGSFFITGYTSQQDEDGIPVFLKNVGDRIILWFDLEKDINAINGNPKLTISSDKGITDQHFGIPRTNFYKGAFIIQQTDYQNIIHDPVIYTNFLEASALPFVNTKISLLEEGDYVAALDYSIGKNHYRIAFEFKIRNGNSMVYLFDIGNGSELTNKAYTETGFRIDLAKSRYLDITVRRSVLNDSADGLALDSRINKISKDNEQFTEEGIYTITVSNRYTGLSTEKIIYVGTNKLLKAMAVNDLPIQQIRIMLDNGATIQEDGTIITPTPEPTATNIPTSTNTPKPTITLISEDSLIITTLTPEGIYTPDNYSDISMNSMKNLLSGIIIGGIILIIFITWIIMTKNRSNKNQNQKLTNNTQSGTSNISDIHTNTSNNTDIFTSEKSTCINNENPDNET